ncbi:MAG: DUF1592 domain-containing protein [Verrucomicrobiota bacterium]
MGARFSFSQPTCRHLSRHMAALLPVLMLLHASPVKADPFIERIVPFVDEYCLECHDALSEKGNLNLEILYDFDRTLSHREHWKKAYDMIDAQMMPPPKEAHQPTSEERAALRTALEEYLAIPDPELSQINPGKPIVSRLNRLQYNNTVRDLFGLDHDVFMLPDRLPTRREHFYHEKDGLPDAMIINFREFGSKYTVLLPMSGLPGENRVAHGFNNRGDAMNISPLQLEKYVSLAGELVNHPSLPLESPRFLALLGQTIDDYCDDSKGGRGGVLVTTAKNFAPRDNVPVEAPNNDFSLTEFRRSLTESKSEGHAAIFNLPKSLTKEHLFDSGGVIAVTYAGNQQKRFTINPSLGIDLKPHPAFKSTSGALSLMNGHAKEKYFDLVLTANANDSSEDIRSLGLCVLSANNATGYVTVTVTLSNHQRLARTALVGKGAGKGNTFFGFQIPEGSSAVTVTVDGAAFGGPYVALGDIGIVTATKAEEREDRTTSPPRERLAHFLQEAFRRTATNAEIERFHQIFEDAHSRGESEADAMRVAIQSALSSPQFLFRLESNPTETSPVRKLNDFELASRLSYFLWASMPDRELFDAAHAGQLGHPKNLEAQVRRMMQDPKIRELGETFAVQWLRLDQIYATKPDKDVFQDFYRDRLKENTLHDDMTLEAVLLFETILVEDRSMLELIDADYSWLNADLMDIYELKSLNQKLTKAAPAHLTKSAQVTDRSTYSLWHRVSLPDKTRGGVVTMGGPLTLTSTPLETSPIKRGNWILETVFHRPPPEPAMNFVLEDEDETSGEPKTLREMFEMHRDHDGCYTCHSRIDPLGFAMEAYDPIGRLRDEDNGKPIDASGIWNGLAYDTPVEFKSALMGNPDEFVRGFIEHVLSYAIGRKLEYYDMVTVRDIQEKLEERDYRFSELILEVVKSTPFQKTLTHPARKGESP